MASNVSEKEARQVAESAREQGWEKPSFGKELFLGNLRLDLIHPQPKNDPAAVEKGEAFLARAARRSSSSEVDPLEIEREAQAPRRRDRRPQGARRAGHEGARAVRRHRPLAGLLQPRAGAGRHLALGARHAALRPPVDRRRRAADGLRLRGAEAEVAAARRQGPHLRLPAHRAGRRLRPRAPRHHGRADRGRLHPQRPQAVGDQRRRGRHRRRDGAGAEVRRPQGRHHRLRPRLQLRRRLGRAPQPVHGPARDRELGDAARGRLRPRGERDREGGHGPEDRPHDPQHRPPRAARDLPRRVEAGDQDRARVVEGARAVGPAGRQARRRRAEDRLHRRHVVRARGDARRLQPARRRQEARHPHRGRAGQAVRVGAGLEGDRRADAGARRPRLRDRRVAEGARREAGAGRADDARHAHQPHLRGLDRDHAPADRARGRRPAPRGGRRAARGRRRPQGQGQVGHRGRQVLLALAAAAGDRRGPEARRLLGVRRSSPGTSATPSAPRASSRARRSTR